MNDFFDRIFLDNPVKNYAIAAGIILLTLLFKRFISAWLAGLLFRVAKSVWKDIDKNSFISLVINSLGRFLLILITIIALHRLNFPEELNAEIYTYTVKQVVHCAGTIILIISFIGLLLRIIDFIATLLQKRAHLTPEQTDDQLVVFFKDFLKVIIVILGILLILKFAFGLHIGGLLTGLSIMGAAIALALRESLENLIASFIIFFDKPFTIGDLVKVQTVTGTVEKIGLRSTRIRTEYKTLVTVPNKQMVDSILDNHSLRTQRRGDLKLELDINTSSEKFSEVIDGIKKILTKETIAEYDVHLSELSAGAAIVVSEYYTTMMTINEFNEIRQEINLQALKLINELQVKMAVPVRVTGL